MLPTYFLNDFEMAPVAPVITGITIIIIIISIKPFRSLVVSQMVLQNVSSVFSHVKFPLFTLCWMV